MEITICPGKAPRRAAVPLSKSEGHRALILAAMAQGETLLPRLPASGDLLATMDCLRQMGTSFTERENSLLVTPIAGPPAAPLRLDCRESGSTLRFLLPVAAALGLRATIYRAGPAAPAPGGGPFGRFAAERHHRRGAAAPLGDRVCRAADPRRFFPAGKCQLPVCFRTDAGAAPFDRAQ